MCIRDRLKDALSVSYNSISAEAADLIEIAEFKELRRIITVSYTHLGSKYSNLSILATLEFSEIKFDKSLVAKLCLLYTSRCV